MADRNTRDWRDRRRAANLAEIAKRRSARAMEVTTPIYITNERGLPEPEGSAVFLQLGDFRFLVSAGHVLKSMTKRPVSADCHGTVRPVSGEITYVYGSPDKTQANDPIDIRVVRLKGDGWEDLPDSSFLHWPEIDHQPPAPRRHSLSLIGYPYTKQRNALKGSTITARAYQLLGVECPSDVYEDLEVDPKVSVLIGFDKKRVWGPMGMATAPDLYGASGCGLWSFGRRIRESSEPAQLSAIGVIWERKARVKYVRGTRISVIVAALTDRYDDVWQAVQSLIAGTA